MCVISLRDTIGVTGAENHSLKHKLKIANTVNNKIFQSLLSLFV